MRESVGLVHTFRFLAKLFEPMVDFVLTDLSGGEARAWVTWNGVDVAKVETLPPRPDPW